MEVNIQKGENEQTNRSLVGFSDQESLRSIFVLLGSRPDSKQKLFSRKVVINLEDIRDLNNKIKSKLLLHPHYECLTKVTVKLDKREIVEFGKWDDYQDFDWKIPRKTEEIIVRWEFLIGIQGQQAPRPHKLIVKIGSTPDPRSIMRELFSGTLEADHDFDFLLARTTAIVEFTEQRLAEELLAVVEEWNLSLKTPSEISHFVTKLTQWKSLISRSIRYSIPIFSMAFLISTYYRIPQIQGDMDLRFPWLLGSLTLFWFFTHLGDYLANSAYQALMEYGDSSPFEITRGDTTYREQLTKDNGKKLTKSMIRIVVTIVYDLSLAVLTYFTLNSLNLK